MAKRLACALAALMFMVFSSHSMARVEGYLGGAFGQAKVVDFCGDISATTVDCDDTGMGLKAFGGVRGKYLGVEAFYANLSGFRIETTYFGSYEYKADGEINAFGASLLAILPVSDALHLYAKGGLNRWKLTWDIERNYSSSLDDDESSGQGTQFGIGARVAAGERVSFQVEYERYNDMGEDDENVFEGSDVNYLSLGVSLAF